MTTLAPTLGIGIVDAVKSGLNKYTTFSGRASRSEYWYCCLAYVLVLLPALIIDSLIGLPLFYTLVAIGTFMPLLSVMVRRLHDTNRSGWWYWIALTGIGLFFLLAWFCFKSDMGENKYGPGPLLIT